MLKKQLRLCGLILFLAGTASAGQIRSAATDTSADDWGNTWRSRRVDISTDTVVIISSAPASSGAGVEAWHRRTITNNGNDELVLYLDATTYTTFLSTQGVHLSSYTADTAPFPREREWYGNAALYGIWNTGGTEGNAGAIVIEQYHK